MKEGVRRDAVLIPAIELVRNAEPALENAHGDAWDKAEGDEEGERKRSENTFVDVLPAPTKSCTFDSSGADHRDKNDNERRDPLNKEPRPEARAGAEGHAVTRNNERGPIDSCPAERLAHPVRVLTGQLCVIRGVEDGSDPVERELSRVGSDPSERKP